MTEPNRICVSCRKPFAAGDDVVVCPECGAPYHRACYEKEGACIFAAQHAADFEYKPEPTAAQKQEQAQGHAEQTRLCMQCYTKNKADALFCEKCGAPMAARGEAPAQETEQPFTNMFVQAVNPEKEIDGVAAKYWTEYIGRSAPLYLYQFDRMDKTHRKTGICWSALLFAPIYFFYRKSWFWGIMATLGQLLMAAPGLFYLMGMAGYPIVGALGLTKALLSNLVTITFFASSAVNVAWGLFATYLYRRSAGKKLRKLRDKANGSAEAFSESIRKHAGPSRAAAVAVVVVWLLWQLLFYSPLGLNLYSISYLGL